MLGRNRSIDKLRAEVENEHRFDTTRKGYDKKAVNAYLEELESIHEQKLDNEHQKTIDSENRNKQLLEQINGLNEKIEELNKKLADREEMEQRVADSIMEPIREANRALTEEGKRKDIKILQLEKQIQAMRENAINYTNVLSTLDDKLSSMLNAKFEECNDIIETWKMQFERNNKELGMQIEIDSKLEAKVED